MYAIRSYYASLYLFLVGRTAAGIFFVIFYMLLSGGVEYIFKPRLVGNRVRMHPLLVFLTIMGGLKLFGILGIVYGPLGATAFLTLTDIYHASYQIMLVITSYSIHYTKLYDDRLRHQ